jgi:hypothetical protein
MNAVKNFPVKGPLKPPPYGYFQRIDANDLLKESQPYWVYKRLRFETSGQPRQLFVEQINPGFIYLLREIIVKASSALNNGSSWVVQEPFFNEMFSSSSLKARQTIPIPIDLVSPPASDGTEHVSVKSPDFAGYETIYMTAPAAVDQNAYGVNASSQGIRYAKKLNYFYPYGDVIRVDFTGIPNSEGTAYLDCVLCGYYIPERALDYWKGAFNG